MVPIKSRHFSLFWCMLCTAAPDISSSTKNINRAARASRLSFRFLWLCSNQWTFMKTYSSFFVIKVIKKKNCKPLLWWKMCWRVLSHYIYLILANKWNGQKTVISFSYGNYSYLNHGTTSIRGNCWKRISESLNQLTDISFKVTQRFVQDHYQTSEKTYKKYTRTPVKSRREKQNKTQQKQKTCEESH